jgi:flagellar hook protein FlgE
VNASPFTVSTTIYDSLGNAHQATVTYIPVTTGATPASFTSTGAANATGISLAPATSQNDTITITSNGPASGTYTITDTLGTTMTVNAGSSATVDGTTFNLAATPPATGSAQTIAVTAAQNGLPAEVDNAAGQAEVPATRWAVQVSFTDGTTFSTISQPGSISANGTVTNATYSAGSSGIVGYVYFDQNGQFINSSSIENAADTAGITGTAVADDLHTTGEDASIAQGNQLNITQWGQSAGNNASAPTAGPPPALGPIALGYWNMSSLAADASSDSGNGTSGPTVISQNGFAAGTLDNITIGDNGVITGAFTNGQNKTLGQVALATFQNEDGLTRVGDNQYEPSANSGLAQIGVAGTGQFGAIQSGALEQSNVSLSTEFTNLIIAQRAFEANTRGITTADQNLQTIINLRASEN